ncbi:MAG: recombinase family protein [Clostridiaceae bacterium]|nr:recombinase family protein [Clostridiaceae bacterium]
MANQEQYTILYGRLSQEDEREGESNSIQNQRLMLEKYATDNGFENVKFLYDDGYSGTNFNRPAWNEVMQLAENGEVATIIVKDTSRKIRAVKKAQAERGERIGTRPPYGYKKSEDNPKQIIPDEQAAEVVQHIFRFCADCGGTLVLHLQEARQRGMQLPLHP